MTSTGCSLGDRQQSSGLEHRGRGGRQEHPQNIDTDLKRCKPETLLPQQKLLAAERSLPKMKKTQTPTRKKLLESVKMKPEKSVVSIKKLFETGPRCRNEDDQSNLERRKLLEKTKTVVVAVIDDIDVVTEPEAEDVIIEKKKKTTVRKLEEEEMQ